MFLHCRKWILVVNIALSPLVVVAALGLLVVVVALVTSTSQHLHKGKISKMIGMRYKAKRTRLGTQGGLRDERQRESMKEHVDNNCC